MVRTLVVIGLVIKGAAPCGTKADLRDMIYIISLEMKYMDKDKDKEGNRNKLIYSKSYSRFFNLKRLNTIYVYETTWF